MPFNPWTTLEQQGAYAPSPGRDEAVQQAKELLAARQAVLQSKFNEQSKKRK
jgi:hypothetical protein